MRRNEKYNETGKEEGKAAEEKAVFSTNISSMHEKFVMKKHWIHGR